MKRRVLLLAGLAMLIASPSCGSDGDASTDVEPAADVTPQDHTVIQFPDLADVDLGSWTDVAAEEPAVEETSEALDDGMGKVPLVVVHTSIPGRSFDAAWFAYQDGDGAWQPLASEDPGTYRFHVQDKAGRYGVRAVMTEAGTGLPAGAKVAAVRLVYATVGEVQSLDVWGPGPWPPDGVAKLDVHGKVGGFNQPGDPKSIVVALGNATATVLQSSPSYDLGVPAGGYDLACLKGKQGFLLRNYQVQGNQSVDLDFAAGGGSFALTPFTATLANAGTDTVTGRLDFLTSRGSLVTGPLATAAPFTFQAPTGARLVDGDQFRFAATATSVDGTGVRLGETFFRTPADLAVTLPAAAMDGSVKVVASSPYLLLQADWTDDPKAIAYGAVYNVKGNTQYQVARWDVLAGKASLGAARTLALPNLHGLAGWDDAWGLAAASKPQWDLRSYQCNKGLAALIQALAWRPLAVDTTIPDGLAWTAASKLGVLPAQ